MLEIGIPLSDGPFIMTKIGKIILVMQNSRKMHRVLGNTFTSAGSGIPIPEAWTLIEAERAQAKNFSKPTACSPLKPQL